MPMKTERRVTPDFNEHADIRERYQDLVDRYQSLRENAEAVVRENKALRQRTPSIPQSTAGVYLVLLAVVILGWLAIFRFVEDGGTGVGIACLVWNFLFGAAAALLLFAWVVDEWKEIAWIAIVKYVFVFVAMMISAKVVTDGALLRGEFRAPATHPTLAALIAIVASLLAASPLAVLVVRWTLHFLNGNLGGNGGK